MAEVLLRKFDKEIQKNLFPDNSFYKKSKVDAGAAVDKELVEIPQAGGLPTVTVNPSLFPLPMSERTDNKKSYSIDLIATEPTLVRDVNEALTSYNKMQDIMEDHILQINSTAALRIADGWAPSTTTFLTTGTTRATSAAGTTGTRKGIAKADVLAIQTQLNKDNIPFDNRYAILPAEMYGDLLLISEFISKDYVNAAAIPEGAVGMLYGFTIYLRSSVLVYGKPAGSPLTATKKAYGAASAVDDVSAGLFWHSSFVRHAEGAAKTYLNLNRGEYLGSTFNAAVRSAGTASRNDGKGIIALAESWVS